MFIILFTAFAGLLSLNSFRLSHQAADATLPNTATPSELIGGWANGFASFTQVVDAYNGRVLGNTWQSGKYFKFTPDGQKAEFYVMGKSQYASFATQVSGTIRFTPESTNSRGSFTFLALKGHYRGWGTTTVDRDATPEELKNNLTRKYYYRMDGEWLRIEPSAEPNDYTSSFTKTED